MYTGRITIILLLLGNVCFSQVEDWELETAPDSNYIKVSGANGEYENRQADLFIKSLQSEYNLLFDSGNGVLTFIKDSTIVHTYTLENNGVAIYGTYTSLLSALADGCPADSYFLVSVDNELGAPPGTIIKCNSN